MLEDAIIVSTKSDFPTTTSSTTRFYHEMRPDNNDERARYEDIMTAIRGAVPQEESADEEKDETGEDLNAAINQL